mmetsp:Transcript_96079/g.277481  ORF Transcript_96079/g.277481 Transcript_96079/m.277481 type:complete len:228 (-) Transcript_96079:1321-2004(-)
MAVSMRSEVASATATSITASCTALWGDWDMTSWTSHSMVRPVVLCCALNSKVLLTWRMTALVASGLSTSSVMLSTCKICSRTYVTGRFVHVSPQFKRSASCTLEASDVRATWDIPLMASSATASYHGPSPLRSQRLFDSASITARFASRDVVAVPMRSNARMAATALRWLMVPSHRLMRNVSTTFRCVSSSSLPIAMSVSTLRADGSSSSTMPSSNTCITNVSSASR